jgi:hypothetical protein
VPGSVAGLVAAEWGVGAEAEAGVAGWLGAMRCAERGEEWVRERRGVRREA